MQKAVQRTRIGNMYAHKNRRDDRCRIASARLEIGQICEDRFRGHVSYSSNIDVGLQGKPMSSITKQEDDSIIKLNNVNCSWSWFLRPSDRELRVFMTRWWMLLG